MTEMQNIYAALRQHGILTRNLRRVLPEWWSEELEESPSAVQQAKYFIAKALSLRVSPFCESPPRIVFDLPDERCFKRSPKTSDAEIEVAVAIAKSASKVAVANSVNSFVPPPPDASAIRKHILDKGAPWVGLEQLINYCWDVGVPVLHLATPLLGKKMDGIALSVGGRPSIVLSNKRKYGYLLFHLAHEIGHVSLKHLAENSAIVDDEISESTAGDARDQREIDADKFAVELLTGNANKSLTLAQFYKAPTLANIARQYGSDNQIDPTHVLLNCAHNDKRSIYPLVNKTLPLIGDGTTDQEVVFKLLMDRLDGDIKFDDEHFLKGLIFE